MLPASKKDRVVAATMDRNGVSVDIEMAHDTIPKQQEIVNLEWININYHTASKVEKKTIIFPMSGRVDSGEMLAIMGTSGAGKSTLLDILSGRLISSNLTGQILVNESPVNFSKFRKQAAYVKQSDSLFPLLTVKETLHYAAHLGIRGQSYAEREVAAEKTMILLGLKHVENTIIGDNLNRGLSGGEKRRVSIAVDIIHEPRIIFLDEPTSGNIRRPPRGKSSIFYIPTCRKFFWLCKTCWTEISRIYSLGLDSTTATTVIEALKGIAVTRNATLIVTIHQPSAKLYAMFDKCLFLSGTEVILSLCSYDVPQ